MSARSNKEAKLVLGASPRVDLLPPEVADRKKAAALRRYIAMGVVGALVISAGGYAFASWQSIQASAKLDDARLETTQLLAQQAEFSEVRTLSAQSDGITDARQAGALTEIDWSQFYIDIVPTLPSGVAIDSFTITSGSPILDLPASVIPTQGPRTATAVFVISSPNLESIAAWLVTLKGFVGYADASATPATSDADGAYSSTVTLNITDARYTKRFAPPEEPAATDADTTANDTTEGTN